MPRTYSILIMGASYGSLLGVKLALAGHSVKLVCRAAGANLINNEGAVVRMPVKGRAGQVEVNSKKLAGALSASEPGDVNPLDYDLVVLAMQEPQYRMPGARELLSAVAASHVPCMSIMNMPPLPYLQRISTIDASGVRNCFADATVWDNFDPAKMTLCSPDPQAFRPPEEKSNVLQVRLPTNFKAAEFGSDADTSMLRDLEASIEAARFHVDGEDIELPVKLKIDRSLFVPLAKWGMLLAGNYRSIQKDSMRPIKDAVYSDLVATRAVYDWITQLCITLGADEKDMVPFEKYANAASSLANPSSAARALLAGATNIERVDLLVKTIGDQQGIRLDSVDQTVALVDGWLARNRAKAV